jgi:hypothetical protein
MTANDRKFSQFCGCLTVAALIVVACLLVR